MSRHKGLPQFKQEKKAVAKLLKELPDVVGQTAVDHAHDNFDREGFSDGGRVDKWASRKDRKNNKGRKILVQSGRGKASIDYAINGNEVGVTADAAVDGFAYMHVHNTGEGKQPLRKFADNSRDIEAAVEKYLDDEMDKIFG